MATIGKITLASSGTSALGYAAGKDKLSQETKEWLKENGVASDLVNTLTDRAVVTAGINVQPDYAVQQMRAVRAAFAIRGKEVVRVIQSFPTVDLSAASPKDWQAANQLGLELAEKAFPNRQVAVYTHLDGNGHKLHNHIVVNMPDLTTGRKYSEHRDWEKIAQLNDQIAQEHGLSLPQRTQGERHTMAERQLAAKTAYVWKDDLRHRIDTAMTDASIFDFKGFSASLERSGVIIQSRGKNLSYAFLDANNKQRRARGVRLGADYEKEAIFDELENRSSQRTSHQLDPAEQTRVDGLARETTGADTALNRREQQTESREPHLKSTAADLDHLTSASRQLERKADEVGANYHELTLRLKSTTKPLTDGLQRFREAVPRFAAQIKQRIIASPLYQDVAQRFQADMAKKEQEKAEKQRTRRAHKNHERDWGGLER